MKSSSDEIYATLECENANLDVISKRGINTYYDLPSEGIGFIGDENVYLVTDSGSVLLSLNN